MYGNYGGGIASVFKWWASLIPPKLETSMTSCSAPFYVQIKTLWLFAILGQQNDLGRDTNEEKCS